jgi:prepilin-type N-terminal cleavage/methylation domain-containing protein
MNSTSPKFQLMRWLLSLNRLSRKGFTLMELLIAIAIGSVIMSTLLYLVVEMTQASRREEVLTQTQQDMQRALDYISRDAREAVYVYSTPTDITGELDDLPAGADPILAFWRLDPIDVSAIGATQCAAAENECNALKIRQSAHTLVVYLQEENGDGSIWGGPSRILRYELPKYDDVSTLTQNTGYSDPTVCNSFGDWNGYVAGCDPSANNGNTDGTVAVLTDSVDALDTGDAGSCPDNNNYMLTSANADSFYSCVRLGLGSESDTNTNQTLVVYLRGNATEGQDGLINTFSEEGRTPTIQSEVLIRGVLNKRVGDE